MGKEQRNYKIFKWWLVRQFGKVISVRSHSDCDFLHKWKLKAWEHPQKIHLRLYLLFHCPAHSSVFAVIQFQGQQKQ